MNISTSASLVALQNRPAVNSGAAQIQAAVDKDIFLQTHPDEDGLHLRANTQSLFLQAKGEAKGTVLMFHGYTGAPWQCPELAAKFNEAGYNVYAPRMPGHGFADANEVPSGKNIPDCGSREEWNEFIDQTYQNAAEMGVPVSAVGLSGGGNVALRMAQRHPEIGKVVAMSPYLGPARSTNGWKLASLFSALRVADKLSFGLVGRILDHLPNGKNVADPTNPLPGTQGSLGSALAMNQVGFGVDTIQADLQLITTEGDALSGEAHNRALFERNGGEGRNGWYQFHKDENVPHALMSPIQNTGPGKAATVQNVAFDFIDKGPATQRP
jgi:pimeloyl-ACP methyl ester carboxylesterase